MAENKFIYSKLSKGESPIADRYATKTELNEVKEELSEDISLLDISLTNHINDKENPHEVTKEQVGLGDVVNKPMDSEVTENSENYISSGAVKTYVDTNGGKIDSISIDGTEIEIVNKNVNLPAYPTKTSLGLDNVDNTSDTTKKSSFTGQIAENNTGFVEGGEIYTALSGKQDTIDSSHKLSADLVDDSNTTNKFVTASDKTTWSGKQDELVSGTNIKTINGQSVLITPGSSTDIQTEAYHTFPNTWHTGYGYTTQEFCESVENDLTAVAGTVYLGTLSCSDLPGGLIQGETVVEIISTGANGKCINLTLTSLTNSPYRWTYSYGRVNSQIRTIGWLGVQSELGIATSSKAGIVKSSTTGTTANRDYNVQVNNDGTMKVNVPWTDTTYSAATTITDGLMSASDKSKLDNAIQGIKVNNVSQQPTDNVVDITVPTRTSDLTNNGDGTSDYATESFVNSSIATNTANFIGTYANVKLLQVGYLTNDSIIKSDSLIRAYSFVNGVQQSTDYTLDSDVTISSKTLLNSGSEINIGSTIKKDSVINNELYSDDTTVSNNSIVIRSLTNNDYAFVTNSEYDFATVELMESYNKNLLTNYDYAWVENNTKYDLYRFNIENKEWDLRATNIDKNEVTLNVAYNRYKCVVVYSIDTDTYNWEYEYTLNNSSFTAAQWASINSGITSSKVGEYDAHLVNTSNPHHVTASQVGLGNVENKSVSTIKSELTGSISSGNTNFVTGGDAFAALANKQATITDGSAIIASVSSDIVTLKAGVSQSSGAISNSSGSDITLSKVAKTGSYNDLEDKPTIPTITFIDWS